MQAKPTTYKVGTARFASQAVAAKVATNKAIFAATVNREGMTDEDRKDAFTSFFAKR
ncbi:hypothetical protein UFOVP833_12 [uncultured Caudovirales phage]|uniref:Uncharacterized protein n=1 Tax=uncultured Caudovirales phage TaxID=2100421 RepID=A0A6J5SS98_9CAUD|nr:hypothetical protein UFOVP833_12 [uncultured Caudovirales phage]CAB4218120.1 hypothetical protein UFOVP1603_13 [uncultured Caudovirales phage]